jgi:hypothetical protein
MSVFPNTPPPPKPPESEGPSAGVPRQTHEAGVPRRFGVGTLLIITTAYAVLFAVMRALEFPPAAFVLVSLFFTAVGLGQMLLFKGRQPRKASVIVGACLYPPLFLGTIILESGAGHRYHLPPDLGIGVCCSIPSGAMAGYLAGILIAGVFLVVEKVRSIRR